jgi:hypothetical protein
MFTHFITITVSVATSVYKTLLVLSANTRNLGLQLLSGHFADTFDELKLDFFFIIKYIVTPTTQITINNRFSEFIFIYDKII